MIDYSVYMQPNPMDDTAAPKAYAKAQMRELMTFSKFINHIAGHAGVFTRGTVRGVIVDMCECLVEQLLEGKKIELGELGCFWLSLTSEGAPSMEEFTAEKIKSLNIVFTPGPDFENLVSKAEFNLVASRVAQAATLKAEKSGSTTVDLAAAKAAAKAQNSSAGTSEAGNSGSTDDTDNTDSTQTGGGGNDDTTPGAGD